MRIKLYGTDKPYIWQKNLHTWYREPPADPDGYKIAVVKASRQSYGKTRCASALLIEACLTKAGARCVYVSPDLKLGRKLFHSIRRGASELLSRGAANDLILEFNNGSTITLFGESQGESLRGFNCSGLMVIDEAAKIGDRFWTEILSPFAKVHKPAVLMISTPLWRSGFFYENYIRGLDPDVKNTQTFDWTENYPPEINEWLETMRASMPYSRFKCEYLGEWLEAEGSVFGDFSKQVMPVDYYPIMKDMAIGIDFGTGNGGDYTVLTALNYKGEQCYIWRKNDLLPVDQIAELAKVIKEIERMGTIKMIYAEVNSIGSVYLDMLRRNGIKVYPFQTTNATKRKIIETLATDLAHGLVRIFNHRDQIDELAFYEATPTANNNITYNAAKGGHDDMVMALAIANAARTYSAINTNTTIKFI